MVFFLGRDCHFFRTSWYFHKIGMGRDGIFFRTRLSLFRTIWKFNNLGRVGHVLRTRWSPFNKFGKFKILGGLHFVIIGGDGVQLLGGGYIPPIPPVSAPLGIGQYGVGQYGVGQYGVGHSS